MRTIQFIALLIVCALPHSVFSAEEFSATQLEFFEKEVRPLLSQHCFECHSAKAKKLQAGLRLDSRKHLIAGGDSGSGAVPGKPDESLLIDAIRYEGFEMPPRGKLSEEAVSTLTKWVQLGMPWPDEAVEELASANEFDFEARKNSHWSWQPVEVSEPPLIKDTNWPTNQIDHFILAKLEENGLAPAPEADRRAQIRRLYFDLIGLPPSREAIQTFLNDQSSGAYERLVDELLASQHFGEKWARHWMDLARYGDTLGHEFDYALHHAFRYRDYLIRAFNLDVPYDQFVTEQIAGDLLSPPRLHATEKYNESIIGTGFWLLGETVHAPTDVRADEAGRIDNQIDVMCKTFLGLTVGCARCHDHKFDPIPTTDYYALTGFLQSSRRQEALLDPHAKIRQASESLAKLNNEAAEVLQQAFGSSKKHLVANYLLAASNVAAKESDESQHKDVSQLAKQYQLDSQRLKNWIKALQDRNVQQPSHPLFAWSKLSADAPQSPRTFDENRKHLAADLAQRQQESSETIDKTTLYKDFRDGSFEGWYRTGDAFGDRPTRGGDFETTNDNLLALPGLAHSGLRSQRLRGVLRSPTFVLNHKQIHYRINATDIQIRLIVDGFVMDVFNALLFQDITLENVKTKGQTRWVTQHRDLYHYVGHRAHIEIIDHSDGFAALEQIRFSDGIALKDPPNSITMKLANDSSIKSLADLAKRYESTVDAALRDVSRSDAATTELLNWLARHHLVNVDSDELTALRKQREEIEKRIPNPIRVQAMADGNAENDRIHIRGNHKNLGDVVPRRLLLAIDQEQAPIQSGSGRLELARRIVDPKNPFTSRVMVNRIWHHLFGRGIVPSVDDFGRMGQLPTHPKLLDWLAHDFVANGWSTKQTIKKMVMSKTYRMSSRSNLDPVLISKADAPNNYLHQARVRRVSAESIRDSVLTVSGRLDKTMFGPSVPVHLTKFLEGRGRPRKSGPLDGAGRRSVYLEVRRNFLSPMMLTFDMPSPFSTMGRRSNSNVPSQSLMMMNDPFIIEQAEIWAKRAIAQEAEAESRIADIFETAIGRLPSTRQLNQLLQFVRQQATSYATGENDLRVWTDVCHTIMNMKEFIYLN